MAENALTQLLLLLSITVAMVLVFQRLRVPSSLAYLAVGVVLGANTAGPVISEEYVRLIAEYGIVFLLFTIGLSFSLSQIYALRHTILGLGTALVYPTLLAAVADVAAPAWRGSAVGVYRLWRDLGFAAGAIVTGLVADLAGVASAIWIVAALTAGSRRRHRAHRSPRPPSTTGRRRPGSSSRPSGRPAPTG